MQGGGGRSDQRRHFAIAHGETQPVERAHDLHLAVGAQHETLGSAIRLTSPMRFPLERTDDNKDLPNEVVPNRAGED
jgi:hypothetical protein